MAPFPRQRAASSSRRCSQSCKYSSTITIGSTRHIPPTIRYFNLSCSLQTLNVEGQGNGRSSTRSPWVSPRGSSRRTCSSTPKDRRDVLAPSGMGVYSPHRRLPMELRRASAGRPPQAQRRPAEFQATLCSNTALFDTSCCLLNVQNSGMAPLRALTQILFSIRCVQSTHSQCCHAPLDVEGKGLGDDTFYTV